MKYLMDYQGKNYIIEYDEEPEEYLEFHIPVANAVAISPERLILRSVIEKSTGKNLAASDSSLHPVYSPIPGNLTAILVREGTSVSRGQPLAVIEAMKMENEVYAPCDGIIECIMIQTGIPVRRSETIMTIRTPKSTYQSEVL